MTPQQRKNLPFSKEAEESLLGAVLLDPSVFPTIGLPAMAFYSERNDHVWTAMQEVHDRGEAIDSTTLEAQLRRAGTFDLAGGVAHLGHLALQVPTAHNVGYYAAIVRDRWLCRRVIEACAGVVEVGMRDREDAEELLGEALARLAGIEVGQSDDGHSIGQIVQERYRELADVAAAKQRGEAGVTGLPTGIEVLDEKLGGYQRGIATIVAARPAMGKSALGLTAARAVAAAGLGAHVFSLEDVRSAYCDRALAQEAGMSAEDIRNCNLNQGQMENLKQATRTYWGLRERWLVDDRAGITAEAIVRSVRRSKHRNNTALVVVDYIQLLRAPRDVDRRREDLIVTRNLQILADAAKQDRMAYLVMSQLNREVERRDDKQPRLSDLRESGGLEERAKCVIGLIRPSVYEPEPPKNELNDYGMPITEEQWKQRIDLLVLKNSNGRIGKVTARWHGPSTRIW